MRTKVVAILESRTGERLKELVERSGAQALLAPALEEVPDVDKAALEALLARWRQRPFGTAIFQTGVGTRALFEALRELDAEDEFLGWLKLARVIVRGPKPSAELNARGVRIDLRAASPFTTETVMGALAGISLQGSEVLVQRYGAANEQLKKALAGQGAAVVELATYRWALPSDTEPLLKLLEALKAGRVDAALFTSAVQVHNLERIARQNSTQPMATLFAGLVIGSIGPVCTRALKEHGLNPTFEADPPKLGPLLSSLKSELKL
ncbi:MAG TPA: uroporphyrinogen-III synthase [Steroidobacteraceae bacterium]|jgi:uroporphyrinogen-III synthase